MILIYYSYTRSKAQGIYSILFILIFIKDINYQLLYQGNIQGVEIQKII